MSPAISKRASHFETTEAEFLHVSFDNRLIENLKLPKQHMIVEVTIHTLAEGMDVILQSPILSA